MYARSATDFEWRSAVNTAVNTLEVAVVAKRQEFALEVNGVPKQDLVEEVSPDRSNEPLDNRVGNRNVGDGLEFLNIEHAKIGLPAMKLEQRVMVEAEVARDSLSGDGVVEHSAQRYPIYRTCLNAEADDPASEQIHHDHHPVGLQRDRFAPE